MEAVLDLYHEPYDPLRPVVCFDEGTKQLIGETRTPLPMQPGEPQRYDYEYERHGTCNLFMFSEPLAAWRQVEVTARRTKLEYAHCLKYLADERYPQATVIRLVQDNLDSTEKRPKTGFLHMNHSGNFRRTIKKPGFFSELMKPLHLKRRVG